MDISKAEKLKQHFSTRVINQARHVLDLWRCFHDDQGQEGRLSDLKDAAEKLLRFAQRFEAEQHIRTAELLNETLSEIKSGKHPTSEQLNTLNDLMQQISQSVLRRTDDKQNADQVVVKKPVYVALNNTDKAIQLAQQMEYFGLRTVLFSTSADFAEAINKRHPMAIIMDVDFETPDNGFTLIENIESAGEQRLPVIFCRKEMNLEQKLRCIRLGAISTQHSLEPQPIINQLEHLVNVIPENPFRVMVVDDSKSQAVFTEKALNSGGMITQVVMNPMTVLTELEAFHPDIVLMDMYMPGCTGVELAKVLRQDNRYLNIPIIYLSGEEDRERQLAAMAEGGDDFLTKPVDPGHLLSTVRNRGKRARELTQLIVRDSLTGLYNHTHILKALDEEICKADQHQSPMCFVMIDIDKFKQINDNYGHPVGDDVIRNLSLFLSQRLRKTDPIGRYGGEEFAVILPNTNLQDAILIIDQIRENYSRLIHGGEAAITSTFSSGIAVYSGQPPSELIDQADQALYKAKKEGRNCVKSTL